MLITFFFWGRTFFLNLKKKRVSMWIEVFKTGEHTDSAGETRVWTVNDLDTIFELYNNQPAEEKHEAPVVIGHPENDAPAYGWVKQLKRKGNKLLAEIVDLDENFIDLVKKRRYEKISVAFYDNLLLRHVGFLGAVPPAVKGLKPVRFAEFAYCFLECNKYEEYMENNFIDAFEQFMTNVLDVIGELFGTDAVAQVTERVQPLKEEFLKSVTEETEETETPDEETEAFAEQKQDPELIKKVNELQKQVQDLKFNEFFDAKVRDGVLLPAQRAAVKTIYQAIGGKRLQFNDKNYSAEDLLNEFLKTMPKQLEFSEFAKKDEANINNQNKVADLIKELKKEYK